MQISVTGSHGLIGSALVARLTATGHQVVPLARDTWLEAGGHWDPETGEVHIPSTRGEYALVHLAGENIAAGRWTTTRKERIRHSRVHGTRRLCQALAQLDDPPIMFVCASAIGFYGDRGSEPLDEQSGPGTGFLADVCRHWEEATEPAVTAGIRVVNVRFGVVLSQHGGALATMLMPFRLGLGGRVGRGQQFWSWISIDDAVGALQHVLATESLRGPVNAVAPHPVTNVQFTKTLGHFLRRPTVFPMPAWVARVVLGEMANDLLLASARVAPRRLLETGYVFEHPTVEKALRHVLGGK